ncbi:MAG TPA: Ig-like domain-containing protein, partial [Deinococcales bacterium]|nr:Ig-like domain-containing protein [Deinococcales bacterium]
QYTSGLGETVTDWYWDGKNHPNGFYFDDPSHASRLLPFDSVYGRVLAVDGNLALNAEVDNVTNVNLSYTVTARLYKGGGTVKQVIQDLSVNSYSRGFANLNFGNLAASFGALGGATDASLEINLSQNGVVQDVKRIPFRVGPSPADAPTVRIQSPNDGSTVLTSSQVNLLATVYDPLSLDTTLPAGNIKWTVDGTQVATGLSAYYTFSAGSHTVQVTATGAYGKTSTATSQVTAVDPTATPGQIVIVSPKTGDTFFAPDRVTNVNLVGYATYSDGSAVPSDKLHWTADGFTDPLGDGSSLTVPLSGGCSSRGYRIRLTVRSAGGSDIGSNFVDITVYAGNPC